MKILSKGTYNTQEQEQMEPYTYTIPLLKIKRIKTTYLFVVTALAGNRLKSALETECINRQLLNQLCLSMLIRFIPKLSSHKEI